MAKYKLTWKDLSLNDFKIYLFALFKAFLPKKKLSNLEKYGLKIEIFGTSSVIVREVPSIISNCDVKKLSEELLNKGLELVKN